MSSKYGAVRPFYKPSEDFGKRKIPVTMLEAGVLLRLHGSDLPALHFGRRAGARFTPEDTPRGVMYLAEDLETCIFEVFGDEMLAGRCLIRAFKWMNYSVSEIGFPALRVCDFTDVVTTTAAGVDLASLMAQDLAGPQAWSRAVMHHRARFQAIRYASRFTGGGCLALFEAPEICEAVTATAAGRLHETPDANAFLDEHEAAVV